MKHGKIIIEKKEHELLKQIISMGHYRQDKTYRQSIEKLSNELQHAEIVPLNKMPGDIIRFNSKVTIEIPGNITKSYQVVIPENSDLKQDKISILAPMGLALFGYAEGDEFDWDFPGGTNTIKILKVTQPEPIQKNQKP